MKFWKLEVNGNDFLLFYKNHKNVNKVTLCSERIGAGAHGWLEVKIQKENIYVDIYTNEGSNSEMFYDGIRCCAYWYMVSYEKEHCAISYKGNVYRLKRWKNLITIEVAPRSQSHDVMIKNDMNFYYPEVFISDVNTYIETYCDAYNKHILHRIALGSDEVGQNLMRYANGFVYVSAIVHMIYEGRIYSQS